MKKGLIIPVVCGFLSVFLFTGCFGVDTNFSGIRNDILSTTGKNFHRDVEFAIGSAGMAFAGMIVSLSDEDPETREIIRYISGVQVGVYKNYQHEIPGAKSELIARLNEKMKKRGWEYIVKSIKDDEFDMVYAMKGPEEELSKIFVISFNKKELAMVEVRGDLEKVLVSVIRKKGLDVQYANAD